MAKLGGIVAQAHPNRPRIVVTVSACLVLELHTRMFPHALRLIATQSVHEPKEYPPHHATSVPLPPFWSQQ